MSQDPNDAIVCLRLELHRVKDQLETVRQVVEFERKENFQLRNEREVLILEVSRLKVEIQRLDSVVDTVMADNDDLKGKAGKKGAKR